MRFTAHPERKTRFERYVIEELGLIHAKSRRASPWQNAFIERSHRTDNEELFDVMEFTSSEERRYQHRLWEMWYNNQRPHQGLGGKKPMEIYRSDYHLHAASRMLM
jgi:transposase InsO family protein